jgi:hypothetical protein
MTDSENPSPILRRSRFQFFPWQNRDFILLLVNGMLLLFVMVCSGKLIFEMLLGSMEADNNELWIALVLTAIAYIYSILLGYGSVRVFEKEDGITNITQILRFYAAIYSFGFCVIYWIAILKLAEHDYALFPRYVQYIAILIVCYIAVRAYASIPKTQDVWLLAAFIFIANMVHAASLVYQYIFTGFNELNYFFQDIAVLIGMALLAVYTLFGSWKVEVESE